MFNQATDSTTPVIQPVNRSRRSPARYLLLAGATLLIAIGWFGATAVASVLQIVDAPSLSASPALRFLGKTITADQVKGEGDDRINILLMGIGGAGHSGGDLADTIIVVSIDPINHSVALLSVPRDLRVSIPGHGAAKINAAQAYGDMDKTDGGPQLMKQVVSTVLDTPIHYYVRLDFQGFIQFINKIGGVSIDVQKPMADPFYPADTGDGYNPF